MSEIKEKKIWVAKYRGGLMQDTHVMARDEGEAVREALATYRFHGAMSSTDPKAVDIVEKTELAADQSAYGTTLSMPVSKYPPEKAVVNLHFQEEA